MNTNVDLITIGDGSLDAFLSPSETETMCTVDSKECLVCFKYGDKIPLDSLNFSVGGNAANNAVGAKRLGLEVVAIMSLGSDLTGSQIKEALEKERINMAYVAQINGAKSNYSTVINYAGERTIFSYHAPKEYLIPDKIPQSKWIYLTSLGDGWEEVFNKVLAWLKDHPETKLALNPGSKQLRAQIGSLDEIFKRTNLLYVNREEAEHFTIMSDTVGKEKDLLFALHQKGPEIVVVTDGPKGAFVFNGQGYFYCPIFPMEAKERTGAGDAFGSGCLSALIKGKSLEEALLWGTLNSASVIDKIGAEEGLLHEEEMAIWLERAAEKGIMVKEL